MLVEDFCIRKESGEKVACLLLVENPVQSMSIALDKGVHHCVIEILSLAQQGRVGGKLLDW